MKKMKFLLIGDLPLATQVFRQLLKHPQVEVPAVLTQYKSRLFKNDPWNDCTCLYDEAKKKGLKIYHTQESLLEDFDKGFFDYGISARASLIYTAEFMKLFTKSLINMHGGILPSRAGLYSSCHSILEGDSQSGITFHIIEEGIDTGDIIYRHFFPIDPSDTAYTVYQKTQLSFISVFKDVLDEVIEGAFTAIPQADLIKQGEEHKYFNKRSLEELKEIDLKAIGLEELDKRVRGLDFPGHEPAYTFINGQKVFLTTRPFYKDERK